jgi:hypothetical protein
VEGDFEKLAYELALRGLDKQENLLEELRARTGVLLAVSSLAASFLGQQAFRHPSPPGLALVALASFVVSVAAGVFILVPGKRLYFSIRGRGLLDRLYAVRGDRAELYRRLTYDLDHFWAVNNQTIQLLTRAYEIAAGALILEILSMVGLIGDILV